MCEIISLKKNAHTLTTATETSSIFSLLRSSDKPQVLERGIPPPIVRELNFPEFSMQMRGHSDC